MAITIDDFAKVWASQSPLTPYEFSESNYKQGWDFVGGTPPSRQMWDYLQKLTDEKIKYIYNNMIPVGVVQAFAGDTTPEGWLLCDGSAVSRTDYAALYAVIGTTYGAGNGSTTFNLPNLVDKFVEGSATAGTVKSAGLPNITGSFGLRPVDGGQWVTWEDAIGAVKTTTMTGNQSNCVAKGSSQDPLINVTIDASRSSAIYGKSTTVQPPALTMRYIIKY